jgi:hypothetical protein
MMKSDALKYTLVVCLLLIIQTACKKLDDNPENPFANQETENTDTSSVDIESIAWLHQNVFAVRCANPACHDGTFEPDFRTMQSTYSSLVYHDVTKNDPQNSYDYRVVPGDAEASWLYNRVTTDDQVLGRMPLYAEPLSSSELKAIRGWINKGAPDAQGDLPQYPNLPPQVNGYQVFDSSNTRVDTFRVNGWSSPMTLQSNTVYTVVFYIRDDTTATADLQNQKIEFSLDRDNFSPFASITPVKLYENVTAATLNTAMFNAGQQIFFRYYVEDEQGASTQFPSDVSEFWWKENYSLIIQ